MLALASPHLERLLHRREEANYEQMFARSENGLVELKQGRRKDPDRLDETAVRASKRAKCSRWRLALAVAIS